MGGKGRVGERRKVKRGEEKARGGKERGGEEVARRTSSLKLRWPGVSMKLHR